MIIRFHKEGQTWMAIASFIFMLLVILTYFLIPSFFSVGILSGLIFWVLIAQFFRNPVRTIGKYDNNIVYAPADGKIVVIEPVMEDEFFKEEKIQVSIFMSPLNVHVNRNPIGGIISYLKYHPGEFLVAWHPKSSTENERTTIVFGEGKNAVLVRQIAGAVARRICYYLKVGQAVQQGEDFGFIKFGSRVDLFLPMDANIKVNIGEVSVGNKTVIAHLSKE
jgi:phosphatidylserine decarboxylase